MPLTRLPTRRLAAALMGAAMLTSTVAAPSLGHGDSMNPEILVKVVPGHIAAGTSATTTVRVKLLRSTHHDRPNLGSIGITPPAGFTITGGTATQGSRTLDVTVEDGVAVIEDANMDTAGQLARISLGSTVACGVEGVVAWTVIAREAPDFDPASRRLRKLVTSSTASSVDGCSLDVLRQPALTGVNQVITSVQADPSGAPVAVRLLDGDGAPASQAGVSISLSRKPGTGASAATLGGTTSGITNGNGVATFAPTLDKVANGYRLDADAGAGIDPVTTAAFNVPGVAVACTGACAGTDQRGTTSAKVAATTSGGILTLSLGFEDVDCDNAVNRHYRGSSEPIVFDVTQGTGRTVVTIGLAAATVTRSYKRYEVCFSSPLSSFQNKYGATIAAGDAGLLAKCPKHHDDDDDSVSTADYEPLPVDAPPCVEKKWKDRDGNVFVRFSVPPGDPRGKI